jgi:hypothetical protein
MLKFSLGFITGVIVGPPVLSVLDKAFGPVVFHTVEKGLGVISRGFESAAEYLDRRIENYNQENNK